MDVAILALHSTGSHAAVDLILAEQEDDEGGNNSDNDASTDIVVLTAHGAGKHKQAGAVLQRNNRA